MLLAGHSLYLKTMSVPDFPSFIAADPDWCRLKRLECEALKIREQEGTAVSQAELQYEKCKCCEGALEWFNMDVTDSGDLHFTGLNHELVGEYLVDGQQMFERMKRAALVKAGHHAELWIKADEESEEYSAALQQRRSELYDKHQQLLREKRSAEQEAE
jgi:hypothetical protein